MKSSYLYLEDLSDPRTLEFAEKHNKKLRKLLGSLPEEILPEVLKWYGVDYVYTYEPCSKKVYVVLRSLHGFRVLEKPGNRVVFEKPGVVIWGVNPSPDCTMLGVGYTSGSDEGVIEVIDLSDLKVVDRIEGFVYSIAWRADGSYYYLRMYRKTSPPDGGDVPSERVVLRDPHTGSEEIVWGKGFPRGYLLSFYPDYEEELMVLLVSKGWSEAKLYAGSLSEPSDWRLLLSPGTPLRPAGVHDGKVYALIYDLPGTGRILEVTDNGTREIVRAHEKYPIEEARVLGDIVIVDRLVDAKSTVEVYNTDGDLKEFMQPEEPSTIIFLKKWGDRILGMVESFNKPMGLYILPIMKPLQEPSVNLGLEVGEDWAESYDGTRIHYFTVNDPETTIKRGVIYGYGGFGISLTPQYIGHLKPLLDHGFTYVMTNLRGGGEYGERWHDAGRRLNKKNVFEDFKAVGSKLKSEGFWIAGLGSSNGGLLVSSVLVHYPGLLDSGIIGYPVIDMLRYHKLYIGSLWIDEYGDPEDPKYRDYLASYSPLHNVENREYPPTMVYTGLHDDRVHPGHALRFTALLEEAGAPVYLRVETKSGHMGADPTVKARELADIEAFLLKVSGLKRLE